MINSCRFSPHRFSISGAAALVSLLCLWCSTAVASAPTQILLNSPNTAEVYSGWVLLDDGDKQWIASECRTQLRDAGLTESITDWTEIGGYADTDNWRSCDALEQAFVDGSGGPGPDPDPGSGTASVTLLLNGTSNLDGWILYEGGTTQWVSEDCRGQLQSAGISEVITDWATISGYQPATWLSCNAIEALVDVDNPNPGPGDGNPPTPTGDTVELLINGAAADGWVIVNDESRIWVSADCRAQLDAAGIAKQTVNWSTIVAYPTGPWRSCDEIEALIGSAGPGDGPAPSGDGVELMINGNAVDGWVRFADNTRQWVSQSCRAQLVLAGIPVAAETWATISVYDTSETWRSCDAIEALIDDDPTAPGPAGVTINGQFVETSISQTEADALMATYAATGGPNWSPNTNYAQTWGRATDPCTWFAVQCDSDTVIGIDLGHDGLVGYLPSELFNLTNLEYLIISSSADTPGLSGPLPGEIGNLQKLQRLVLQNLGLSGPLPYQLYTLTELDTLFLNDNALTQAVSSAFVNLQKLRILNLSNNELGGEILPMLAGIPTLRTVALSNNQFSGPIPAAIGNITRLDILLADRNFFTGTIPGAMGDVPRVNLDLSYNSLSGPLPPTLGSQPGLKTIVIESNDLTGPIPDSIWSSQSLQILNLRSNDGLTGTIPADVGNMSSLDVLDLGGNLLSGPIPPEVTNTNLSILDLAVNEFSGPIPTSLGSMTRLRELSLTGNQLTGQVPASLGSGPLRSTLEVFSAGDNQLSGQIPASLGSLSSLRILVLRDNQLTGNIPSELANLRSLKNLSLNANQLSGPIPVALGTMNRLAVLALGGNQLSGQIPSALGQMTDLRSLSLDGNNLTGSIPGSLGSLSNLGVLGLSDNNLTGEIPSTLGQLTSLNNLGLENNFLVGEIPASFSQLRNVSILDVRSNQLTGDLSALIGSVNLVVAQSRWRFADGTGYGPNGVGNNCFTALNTTVAARLNQYSSGWNECN